MGRIGLGNGALGSSASDRVISHPRPLPYSVIEPTLFLAPALRATGRLGPAVGPDTSVFAGCDPCPWWNT
jgi:hypothetical protein